MKYGDIKFLSRKLRKNQTPAEKILWERLKNKQIEGCKFLRQYPILYDRSGNDLNFFILDFYCCKAKLAIELDGEIHCRQAEYDSWRQKIVEVHEITILRFNNHELNDIENVISKIKAELKKRIFK